MACHGPLGQRSPHSFQSPRWRGGFQRGHPGRASTPGPARGRTGPHRRPARPAGGSRLRGEARCPASAQAWGQAEGRGQPGPKAPPAPAVAGVHTRSGAQGTAELASKGGGSQSGAQGSEGAALDPCPDEAGSLRARARAGGGQGGGSPVPGGGVWPQLDARGPAALGGAHPCAPTPPAPAGGRVSPREPEPSDSAPPANKQFLPLIYKAGPAGAFSRGVAWEPLVSAACRRLVTPPPPRRAFHRAGGPRSPFAPAFAHTLLSKLGIRDCPYLPGLCF